MNERPEDDPTADTGMFRAYVEQGADDSTSAGVPVGVLVGTAVVLMIVVVVLILLLI